MDVLHNFKQYFSFTKREARDLIITSLVLGFIFSFSEWGIEVFDIRAGIYSWFNAFLVAILAVLIHVLAQKLVAIHRGYTVQYKLWEIGLVAAILVVFLSNGMWYVAIPGTITVALIKRFRLGKRWQGALKKDEAHIAFAGPFANIFLAIIFQGILNAGFVNLLIEKVVLVNTWMAVFSILPIPFLDGFKIFYHSRTWGLFSVLFIGSLAVFLTWFSFWQTIITALVLTVLISIVYFIKFEL